MFKQIAFTSLICLASSAALAQQEDDPGEIMFNNHCRKCHSIKAGDNRLGPSLHGIVGKEAGTVAGFGGYSGGLKGFNWDEAMLDKFIADPASVSQGTNMIYPPVKDPAERKQIIEFMKKSGGE
jgi:cytochrome c